MKYFFFDLETTGLENLVHGVHQIAAIIETPEGTKELNYKVRPRKGCLVSPEAMKICNVTVDQLRAYPDMRQVYRELESELGKLCNKFNKKDKFFLVGYNNASFDNDFLRRFWSDNGDKYFGSWFWPNPLDVYVLATQALAEKRHLMNDFKLKTVAAEFGVDVEEGKLHDAMYDVRLTKHIYDSIFRQKQENHSNGTGINGSTAKRSCVRL